LFIIHFSLFCAADLSFGYGWFIVISYAFTHDQQCSFGRITGSGRFIFKRLAISAFLYDGIRGLPIIERVFYLVPNDDPAGKSDPSRASTTPAPDDAGAFSTTHWSVVLEAARSDSTTSAEALDHLCRLYWYPLYAFARRRGSSPEEAEDLTQGFFERLIEKEGLKTVAREKGRFRSFLITSFSNFANNEQGKRRAQKRGGLSLITSWDELEAEQRYLHEPLDGLTPEMLFERRWAFTMVEQVLGQLRKEYAEGNKLAVFTELQGCLTQEADPGFIAAAAQRLRMTDGALKVALHRFRRRFGEHLRAQVASTVAAPDQIDEELRHLVAALST
jgi:RNA polymerase sigma factor (sigma-70 family)